MAKKKPTKKNPAPPRRMSRVTPGPMKDTEEVVPYYAQASVTFDELFDESPTRHSLYNYLQSGYPIRRGGPYVRMPVFFRNKRPMTTVEAMRRFITVVRTLDKKTAHNGRGVRT